MIPNVDVSIVQGGQHPRLGGMKVHAFDTIRSGCKPSLDVQFQRLYQEIEKVLHYIF